MHVEGSTQTQKVVRHIGASSWPGFPLYPFQCVFFFSQCVKSWRLLELMGFLLCVCAGRLTLTNKALYFEASGVVSYEPALKINLWKTDVDHQVKTVSTGPWGAPLFDKAISYQSFEM